MDSAYDFVEWFCHADYYDMLGGNAEERGDFEKLLLGLKFIFLSGKGLEDVELPGVECLQDSGALMDLGE